MELLPARVEETRSFLAKFICWVVLQFRRECSSNPSETFKCWHFSCLFTFIGALLTGCSPTSIRVFNSAAHKCSMCCCRQHVCWVAAASEWKMAERSVMFASCDRFYWWNSQRGVLTRSDTIGHIFLVLKYTVTFCAELRGRGFN